MLDHLIEMDPMDAFIDTVKTVKDASPQEVLDAQYETAQWLEQLGVKSDDEVLAAAGAGAARDTFTALTTADANTQKKHLLTLRAPPAVRHLVGMLTAYDWEFVGHAKQLRGYAVSQLVEETRNPDPRIRLRALELLGRVTEVALFTDRVEVKKIEMTDHELDAKLREKLSRFLPVEDATVVDVKPADEAA